VWTCSFRARAGPRASAIFSTDEQARGFAERHAGLSAAPFIWTEIDDAWLLSTLTPKTVAGTRTQNLAIKSRLLCQLS
jgi:hypothetical protein